MKHNRRRFLGRAAATLAAMPLLAVGAQAVKAEAPGDVMSAGDLALTQYQRGLATFDQVMEVARSPYAEPGTIVMGSGTSISGAVLTGALVIPAGAEDVMFTNSIVTVPPGRAALTVNTAGGVFYGIQSRKEG